MQKKMQLWGYIGDKVNMDYTNMKFLLPNKVTEYTIKEKLWTKCGTTYNYIMECSICSKDTELWHYGSIVSCSGSFRKAINYHCGCSVSPKYSRDQYDILCRRKAESLGFLFLFIEDFDGTRLCVLQNKTGTIWKLGVHVFLCKGTTDPDTRKVKFLSVEDNIRLLEDSKLYAEGTVFNKDERGWFYECGICSLDELSLHAGSDTRFYNRLSRLKTGVKSCRCSSKYIYSEKEYNYLLTKICDKEGLTYAGFPNGAGKKKRFEWFCEKGHKNKGDPWGFIYKGYRCEQCRVESTPFSGRFENKLKEKDTLYVIKINNEYVKVGRTFDLRSRVQNLKSKKESGSSAVEVLGIVIDIHENIWTLEQQVHEELRVLGLQFSHHSWNSLELFILDSYNDIISLIQNKGYNYVSVEEAVTLGLYSKPKKLNKRK